MNEQEYRKHPAMNYSAMAQGWHDGRFSPDHALIKTGSKAYFETGKMFEVMLQDAITGSKEAEKRFFQSSVAGEMPDDLPAWIAAGEDLDDLYIKTKTGKLHGSYKTRHAFLDECQYHPGKIPISINEFCMINALVDSMVSMEYQGVMAGDFLGHAEWQVPCIWTSHEGHEKKALFDCKVELDDEIYIIDIKTTANMKQFRSMLYQKYWVQALHYTEGARFDCGHEKDIIFVFFVASKAKPFVCQPVKIGYKSLDAKLKWSDRYDELCFDYHKWVQGGRQPAGYLPEKEVLL